MYAPTLAKVLIRSARNRPSPSSASAASLTLSRACSSASTASLRSHCHLTGRRSRFAPNSRRPRTLRPKQPQPVLGILPALGAEAAADIAGNDADMALRDLEDAGRQRLPYPVRILHIGIERVALLTRAPCLDR